MKEQQQDQNPLELINPQETSPELMRFAREGWRRGRLRFSEITTPNILKRKFFRFLVTKHEVGHAIVARAKGWIVKSFTALPGPGYEGMVQVAPPSGITVGEYHQGLGEISAAGQEAINNKMGAGSDDNMVDFASYATGMGKSRIHSNARSLMGSKAMVEAVAWQEYPEAA